MPKSAYTTEDFALAQPLLGQQVRAWRQRLDIDGKQLGERIGRSATFVSQVERGRALPSVPVFIRLCLALRCSPNDLLSWDTK